MGRRLPRWFRPGLGRAENQLQCDGGERILRRPFPRGDGKTLALGA